MPERANWSAYFFPNRYIQRHGAKNEIKSKFWSKIQGRFSESVPPLDYCRDLQNLSGPYFFEHFYL